MKQYPIKGFARKMMIASKAVNSLPDEYLSYARNARIYDGGIWPRRGKELLVESTIGTKNQGGFIMGGNLYQITNSNIYQVDTTTGVQTLKAAIGYDSITDVVPYVFPKGAFVSLGTETDTYNFFPQTTWLVWRIQYNRAHHRLDLLNYSGTINYGNIPLTVDNTAFNNQAVRIWLTGTTGSQIAGTGRSDNAGGYYLEDGQYMSLATPTLRGNPTISIANPAVVSLTGHGLNIGDAFYFTTTGALPTGITANTPYYILASGFTINSFQFASTVGGTAIVSTGTQSGTHSLYAYTAGGYYTGSVKTDVGYFNAVYKAIIVSPSKALSVFDGSAVTTPATVPGSNDGIIEYCRGYTFISSNNVLYISRPITPTNPEYAYDFTGTGSQQIVYDSPIVAMRATMTGIYIFTDYKVEYIGANALQNVAGSATFISSPLAEGSAPINNLCVTASGESIFYISDNLQVQTIKYMDSTSTGVIGELSARPVISIKEFLDTLDREQPYCYGIYNENSKTIEFQLRTTGSPFNDIVLVYDKVSDTWVADTGKNYNYVVKDAHKYYGFSDINSSIYLDDTGTTNAGIPIGFHIKTLRYSFGTMLQKVFEGFMIRGAIGDLSKIDLAALVDNDSVFADSIQGESDKSLDLGELWGSEIGGDPVWGDTTMISTLSPFDRIADQSRIYRLGTRIEFDISSNSEIQDFILDTLTILYDPTMNIDISNRF